MSFDWTSPGDPWGGWDWGTGDDVFLPMPGPIPGDPDHGHHLHIEIPSAPDITDQTHCGVDFHHGPDGTDFHAGCDNDFHMHGHDAAAAHAMDMHH